MEEGSVVAVVLVVLAIAGYLASLALHPFRDCPRCGGSAKHRGFFYSSAHRPCRTCGGTGKLPRLGRRLFGPPG